MAYKIHHCNQYNETLENPPQTSDETFKTLVTQIIFEDEINVNSSLSFPPPLGVETDPKNGSIIGTYTIIPENKPNTFWKIENNILLINGLCPLLIKIHPSNKNFDCIPLCITVPITAIARLTAHLPDNLNVELFSEFQGASLMGNPPPNPHCKTMLMLNVAFSINIRITSTQTVNHYCFEGGI